MKFKNKQVLVYGLGSSGRSAIRLLKSLGAHVSFFDDDIKYYGYLGFEKNPSEKRYDLVVLSPGVKVIGNGLIKHFQETQVPIITELDLGFLFCKGKIIGITGTNGKTTTSMLVGKILREGGKKTFVCGNIGMPISSVCKHTSKESVTVVELSSFQLEMAKIFRPDIACICNISSDHLDRHITFENYVLSKSNIAQRMKWRDLLVLNFDDENTKEMILHKKHMFFSKKVQKKGVFLKNNQIFANKKSVISLNCIKLRGEKNLENVLAAIAICQKFGFENCVFEKAISSFSPSAHRMQEVGVIDGVTYIDDSKATNPNSTVCCLQAYEKESKILLLGGADKHCDFDEIFDKGIAIKKVICFGSACEKIFFKCREHKVEAECFEKFSDAVLHAKSFAARGDFVLLSPACASFDEFGSYAERGDAFANLVLQEVKI